jgi:hypothetical protein
MSENPVSSLRVFKCSLYRYIVKKGRGRPTDKSKLAPPLPTYAMAYIPPPGEQQQQQQQQQQQHHTLMPPPAGAVLKIALPRLHHHPPPPGDLEVGGHEGGFSLRVDRDETPLATLLAMSAAALSRDLRSAAQGGGGQGGAHGGALQVESS